MPVKHERKHDLTSVNYYTRESIESHIIDINNKLFDLCKLLNLDLDQIKPIHPDKKIRDKRKEYGFGDDEKRAIIAAIEMDERKEAIKNDAMKAAGITKEDYDKISKEDIIKKMKGAVPGINPNPFNIAKDEYRNIVTKDSEAMGNKPPKTDWKKITVDASEKNKIIESIKANKESKHVFSKEFKWEPEEFLEAFKYLEEAKGYTGPFLTALVDKKPDLERLSKNPKLKDGIYNMYLGKYVVLSVYDITADPRESKQLYIGLEYLSLIGRLSFHALTSTSPEIKKSQKFLVKEFLDAMDIIYDENHTDLI